MTLLTTAMLSGQSAPNVVDGKKSHRHLFIDDADVQKTSGLTRTMHQPAKRGAVLKLNEPCVIQIRSSPMWVESEQRYTLVYIASYPVPAISGRFFATSVDGIKWEIPDLQRPPGALSGPPNRVLVQSSDPRWRGMDNVIFDPDETNPAHRYKALLGSENRMPGVSANGYDYKVLSANVIPSSDESQLYYDQANKRYIATLKHGNKWGRAVSLSTSTDFIHWTEPKMIFGTDDEDQRRAREIINHRISHPNNGGPMFVDPEPADIPSDGSSAITTWICDVYNMPVFSYQGLYIGLPSILYRTGLEPPGNNTDGFHEIQLAVSRDLWSWTRVGDRKPFIPTSQGDDAMLGVFDRNGLFAASHPIERGEELWFYYTGIKFRTSPYQYRQDWSERAIDDLSPMERADYEEGSGAVCLAVLRKDGFISLDATARGGFVETKPLEVVGDELFLNVNVAGGEARVAVLDESGKPIAGFRQTDCQPVAGDSTRASVRWNAKGLEPLVGSKVRFQVHLKNARLYSLWTE